MKRIGLACVCVLVSQCLCQAGQKTVVFKDATAVLRAGIESDPVVRVGQIRTYEAITSFDGVACTVVTGKLLSLLPDKTNDITVEITLYRLHPDNWVVKFDKASTIVYQVPKAKPVPFAILCPRVIPPNWDGMRKGYRLAYSIVTTFRQHSFKPDE